MEKRSNGITILAFIAGTITTTIIGDINGWFLSHKFPIVFNIIGFQFSIGLSLLITLLFLVVMGISFYVGHIFAFYTFAKLIIPTMKLPLLFKIVSTLSYPVFWIFSSMLLKWQKEERRRFDLEITHMKKELEEEQDSILPEGTTDEISS